MEPTGYSKVLSTLVVWTVSRTVSTVQGRQRWASSRTSRSA